MGGARSKDARQVGLNVSKTADGLGFSHVAICGVYRDGNIQWAAVLWVKCLSRVLHTDKKKITTHVEEHP